MYLKQLSKQEKAVFLAIAKYIFNKGEVEEKYKEYLMSQYEEEMGYQPGFSSDLPIPKLDTILNQLEGSSRENKRKLFLELVGLLISDEQMFNMTQEQLHYIANYLDVKIEEYEGFLNVILELKEIYNKITIMVES